MLLADSTLQNLQTSIYNLCGEETGAITIYKIFWENIDGGIGWLPTATRTSEISTWLFACGFVFWLFVKFWSGKAHNESYQGVVPGMEMLSQGGGVRLPTWEKCRSDRVCQGYPGFTRVPPGRRHFLPSHGNWL